MLILAYQDNILIINILFFWVLNCADGIVEGYFGVNDDDWGVVES